MWESGEFVRQVTATEDDQIPVDRGLTLILYVAFCARVARQRFAVESNPRSLEHDLRDVDVDRAIKATMHAR